jgi:RimJ/RimL family protein N-acetyltransferase
MTTFVVRPGRPEDARALAELFAAVAEERNGIAAEPPVDVDRRAKRYEDSIGGTLLAVDADGTVIGSLDVIASGHGFGEIGMMVARPWRSHGVGSALVAAAIEKARTEGLHKLALEVFPHNEAAVALYRKFGFVEEGRRVKHYRRSSGELWDTIVMGLLL